MELEFIKSDETIKILKADILELKNKLDKAEEKYEDDTKHIIQIKGESDLKDLELSSSIDIINNLRQSNMNLEQKLMENETKYNSNLDILENRLNDALEERKRQNDKLIENNDLKFMKDRLDSQNSQIKTYIKMFGEKDFRITELQDEKEKLSYQVNDLNEKLEKTEEGIFSALNFRSNRHKPPSKLVRTLQMRALRRKPKIERRNR